MRVEWDENKCAVSGLRTTLAPEAFQINEYAQVEISSGYSEADRSALEEAANSCPTQAITITE
jgi:ferredoxin